MKVIFLDLETGKREPASGICQSDLVDGNWSCDCNRAVLFGLDSEHGICDGYKRFIVIAVLKERNDEPFESAQVIREANRDYYLRLQRNSEGED